MNYKPGEYYTKEDVAEVLKMHDFHCIFELNAPHKIAERLSHRTIYEWLGWTTIGRNWNMYVNTILPEFKQCFSLSEIYCPHEGIDRRAEYGLPITQI